MAITLSVSDPNSGNSSHITWPDPPALHPKDFLAMLGWEEDPQTNQWTNPNLPGAVATIRED